MEMIRFEKIAGDGPDALYSLYHDNEHVADGLTLDEVLARVTQLEKQEGADITRGGAMKAARRRAGLTLRQLAAMTGTTPTAISRMERGLRNGSITTIEILADALGISIDEYTGHEVERND